MLLADQDRSRWDRALVAEGQDLVRRCLRRNRPGPYQIQAAINAVHSDAATAADTDWAQILALYDQLMAVAPSPVVALNRAVAVAEVSGPAAGLAARRRPGPRPPPPASTPSAPTCSAGSAAPGRGGGGLRRGDRRWPATPASGRSSAAAGSPSMSSRSAERSDQA